MQGKNQEYRIGPGASSLLMIFVALCLTTVAILALVSAIADTNMTNRAEETVDAYYVAAARVQREISALDAKLVALRKASADEQSYADGVFKLADELDPVLKPSVQPIQGSQDALVSLSVPMYGGHEIFVQLMVPTQPTGKRYAITAHMVQDTSVWMPNDSMQLFQHDEGASFEDAALSNE